jgi:bacterioferritin
MGTKGTEIVELDVQEVIADLNRAYADEWLAVYSYTHMAQVVTGRPAAKHLAGLLQETAAEELEHQEELASASHNLVVSRWQIPQSWWRQAMKAIPHRQRMRRTLKA